MKMPCDLTIVWYADVTFYENGCSSALGLQNVVQVPVCECVALDPSTPVSLLLHPSRHPTPSLFYCTCLARCILLHFMFAAVRCLEQWKTKVFLQPMNGIHGGLKFCDATCRLQCSQMPSQTFHTTRAHLFCKLSPRQTALAPILTDKQTHSTAGLRVSEHHLGAQHTAASPPGPQIQCSR